MPFERDEQPAPATAETTTATTAQANLLPRELPPPAEMAEILKARPDRQQMLVQLQQTAGNAYVQQVVQLAMAEPEAGVATLGGEGGDGEPHAGVVVTVKLPPNPTQQQALDAIARSPAFGFQDADVTALNRALAANPSLIYVQTGGDGPASSTEIEKKVNPRTRMVTITVDGRDAATLESVKAGRATASVDALLNPIDPELRAELRPLLLALLGPAGETRNAAAEQLAYLIDNDKPIAPILDALAARGYGSDPLVGVLRGLANAKASRAPKDFVGPLAKPGILDPERAETAEREATAANDTLKAQQATGGANRAEAATVYELTARLYGKTGNREAQEEAEMTSRFYGIEAPERDRATRTRARWIDRDASSQGPMMKPRANADVELEENQKRMDEFAEEAGADREATEVPEGGKKHVPTAFEIRGQSREWLKGEREAEEVGESYVGAVAIIKQAAEFGAMLGRMDRATRLIAEHDRLTRESWLENHYPVPPPVEQLERVLELANRVAARGGPHAAAAKRDAAMIQRVLELSRIFYNLPG